MLAFFHSLNAWDLDETTDWRNSPMVAGRCKELEQGSNSDQQDQETAYNADARVILRVFYLMPCPTVCSL